MLGNRSGIDDALSVIEKLSEIGLCPSKERAIETAEECTIKETFNGSKAIFRTGKIVARESWTDSAVEVLKKLKNAGQCK